MRSKVAERILSKTPKEDRVFVSLYADIVVRVNRLLKERGMSRKELAERMDKKPSEISKWLAGEHNFTLRSLAKLQTELGEPVICVPRSKPFVAVEGKATHFTVYKNHVRTDVAYAKMKIFTEPHLANVS